MEGIRHRFVRLQIENGNVISEPAAAIPTVMRFAADPLLTRAEWREGLAYLAAHLAKTRTGDVLERIDRAVSVTARPGLPTRPVQMIDVDDAGGAGFRAVCSIGELATLSRLNLVVDLHSFAIDGGAKRVQRLLDELTNWLINAPDPLPNAAPAPKRKAGPEQRVEATQAAPAASQARH